MQNGVFAYIIPNNWLTINSNKALREFVLKKSNVQVVNFYKRVFESADVDSSILIFNNTYVAQKIKLSECIEKNTIELIIETENKFFKEKKDFIINIELFKNDNYAKLIEKIEENSVELKELADVKVGLKAYQIGKGKPLQTKYTKDNRIFHSNQKVSEAYFKYLEGSDVKRYSITWDKMEYLKWGKHLAEPRANWGLFSTPRILVRQIPSKPPFCINACYTNEILLNDLNSMIIINILCNPLYILGVLNSRAVSFWFVNKFGKMQRGLFPQFKTNELATFPIPNIPNIPNISNNHQQPIVTLVNQILEAKQDNSQADTLALEVQIDQLVYELYGLTPEEIDIIEGN